MFGLRLTPANRNGSVHQPSHEAAQEQLRRERVLPRTHGLEQEHPRRSQAEGDVTPTCSKRTQTVRSGGVSVEVIKKNRPLLGVLLVPSFLPSPMVRSCLYRREGSTWIPLAMGECRCPCVRANPFYVKRCSTFIMHPTYLTVSTPGYVPTYAVNQFLRHGSSKDRCGVARRGGGARCCGVDLAPIGCD